MKPIDRIFELTEILGISIYEFTKNTHVSNAITIAKEEHGTLVSGCFGNCEAYPLNLKWLIMAKKLFLDEKYLKMQANMQA
jgi:hypothetical protein